MLNMTSPTPPKSRLRGHIIFCVVFGVLGLGYVATSSAASHAHIAPHGLDTTVEADAASETTNQLPNGSPIEPGDEIVQSWSIEPGGNAQRSTLTYDSEAGLIIRDSVTVRNFGNVSLNLSVYATDAINSNDGSLVLLSLGETPKGVGSWISLAQELVTVPAGKATTVPFELTIPPGADPGDHTGGIVASTESTGRDAQGNTVILNRRTGVRLYLRLRGELRSNLVAEGLSVRYSPSLNPFDGRLSARFRIVNRGNVRESGTYQATLSGAFGSGKKVIEPVQFPELLPGQSVEVVAEASGIPGWFSATATVVVTASPGGDVTASLPTVRKSRVFAAPLLLLLLLAVALATFAGWRMMTRWRRGEDSPTDLGDLSASFGGDFSESSDAESEQVVT